MKKLYTHRFVIATKQYREGDTLPSVRKLSEEIGINFHTVNKAYSRLKEEGFLKMDRRRGAVVAIDANKEKAICDMKEELKIVLAKGYCKGISQETAHELVDEIFCQFVG